MIVYNKLARLCDGESVTGRPMPKNSNDFLSPIKKDLIQEKPPNRQ